LFRQVISHNPLAAARRNGRSPAGERDGIDDRGRAVSGGINLYQLQTGSVLKTRDTVLVR